MKIEKISTLVFTEEEVIEMMINELQYKQSDLLYSDPEYARLQKIIDHAQNTSKSVDVVGNQFFLTLDGVSDKEEF